MMTAKLEAKSKEHKDDVINLLILILIASAVGVYLIATTVLIAKDGTVHVRYARELAVEPLRTIQGTFIQPGYPFLVCVINRLISLFHRETSLESWIISAQCASLFCKIIVTVVLYFGGSLLVGPRISFWAVLILTILPLPARYGSDALTDWPHILFLAAGFWLMLWAAKFSKWWVFGCAGLIAGLGYLIRSECCQLVVYGGGWLLFSLVRQQKQMSKLKTVGALIVLLVGFAAVAVPYMSLAGYIFPEQRIGSFRPLVGMGATNIDTVNTPIEYFAAPVPTVVAEGIWKLSSNICETLMYYFVPALVIGIYSRFKRNNIPSAEKFFVSMLLLLNTGVLIWLYCIAGFISKRHSMPMVVFTIFYVPVGLQVIGKWLMTRFSKDQLESDRNHQLWFFALLVVGVTMCLPKLFRPIRSKKQCYKAAARWLMQNTGREEAIAVPDQRISFYAERRELVYDKDAPEQAKYVVRIVKDEKEIPVEEGMLGAKEVFSIAADDKRPGIVIYDLSSCVSEKVSFVDYNWKKIADEKYRFSFLFKVNKGFEEDWRFYFHGFVKDEDVVLLPKNRQRHKFDNWDFNPQPATSLWPKNKYITVTREISAKPICYNLSLGFFTAKDGRHGRQIFLGWVDLADTKQGNSR